MLTRGISATFANFENLKIFQNKRFQNVKIGSAKHLKEMHKQLYFVSSYNEILQLSLTVLGVESLILVKVM